MKTLTPQPVRISSIKSLPPNPVHVYVLSNILLPTFPSSLTIFYAADEFNSPLNNLPDSVQSIILCHLFNQNVDRLPNSLVNLEFSGGDFNQPMLIIFRKLFFSSRLARTRTGQHSINQLTTSMIICSPFTFTPSSSISR